MPRSSESLFHLVSRFTAERDELLGRVQECQERVAALVEHPQLRHRGFYSKWSVAGRQMTAPGAPWRGPGDDRQPPEVPGQDTESVLRDWLGS